jgi:hypothetical protein
MAHNKESTAGHDHPPERSIAEPNPAANTTIWVTPVPVLLTGSQLTAALYAFSDLPYECSQPASATVGEEVRFLVARHGADAIERAAEWLAVHGTTPIPASLHVRSDRTGHRAQAARLAWCREQSHLLLASEDARNTFPI